LSPAQLAQLSLPYLKAATKREKIFLDERAAMDLWYHGKRWRNHARRNFRERGPLILQVLKIFEVGGALSTVDIKDRFEDETVQVIRSTVGALALKGAIIRTNPHQKPATYSLVIPAVLAEA
jgi:hypothetical protein